MERLSHIPNTYVLSLLDCTKVEYQESDIGGAREPGDLSPDLPAILAAAFPDLSDA